jgi:hypothetical protein
MQGADFLRRGAALLSREDPGRWRRIGAALGGGVLRLRLGSEILTVWHAGGRLQVRSGAVRRADHDGAITPATLVALVEGRVALLDAILSGQVSLRARPEALPGLAEAFRLWVDAALRHAALQELWEEWVKGDGVTG